MGGADARGVDFEVQAPSCTFRAGLEACSTTGGLLVDVPEAIDLPLPIVEAFALRAARGAQAAAPLRLQILADPSHRPPAP